MATFDEMAVIGSPIGGAGGDAGDPGCTLHAYYFIPSGAGPFPFMGVCHSGGFAQGGLDGVVGGVCEDLKAQGFFVAFFETRLMLGGAQGNIGIPGQTTDGRFQQQTNDALQCMTFLRAEPRCNGFVGALGGSGSGYIVLWIAENGIAGGTRPDAVICLSPPTDFSDRPATPFFVNTVCDYGRESPTDTTPPTLAILRGESPIAFVNSAQAPVFHYNGGNEAMPATQFNLYSAEISAKGITNWTGLFIATSTNHSFGAWNGAGVRNTADPWLLARYNDWVTGGGGPGGGPPPPPPPVSGIDHYEYLITGGPTPFTGNVDGSLATTTVTGLPAGIPLAFFLRAWNQWGPSDWARFDFTSDRASGGNQGGGGRVPIGVIDLLPTDNTGQLPGIASLPVWANPNIIGCRLHTQWQILQPLSGTATDTSLIETFLNLCKTNRKRGCVSVGLGTGTPAWALAGLSTFTDADGNVFPVPWDPNYITLATALIATLGGIYDGDSRLSHFVVALGSYGTTAQSYVVNPESSNIGADLANLTALAASAGFSSIVLGWETFAKAALQAYGRTFPTTSMMTDLFYAVPPGADLDQQSVSDLVAFTSGAFGNKACLSNELLDENLLNGTEPDFDFVSNFVIAALQYAFTTRGISSGPTQFQNWMTAGIAAAPNYIEIYDSDAAQSGYQTIIATTAMDLRNAQAMKRGG